MEIAEQSGTTPEALANRPALSEQLDWWVTCFNEMGSDRGYTSEMPLRLSTTAIEFYRQLYQIPDKDHFHRYIRMIDGIWYMEVMKKQDKALSK